MQAAVELDEKYEEEDSGRIYKRIARYVYGKSLRFFVIHNSFIYGSHPKT